MYQLSYHFLEIRLRFFYLSISLFFTFLISYYYQMEILYLIGRPFLDLDHKFILIDLTEGFYTILRICGIISFIVILPFFTYQFWSFYIPSRYNFERKSITNFFIVFFFFLIVELVLLYFLIFPKICEFLLNFDFISSETPFVKQMPIFNLSPVLDEIKMEESYSIFSPEKTENIEKTFFCDIKKSPLLIELNARLESYVKLSTRFYFVTITLFQIPFLIIFLYYYKILDCYTLCKIRKFFLFSSFLFSALISPPDIISQFIIAIFLFFLYEFLIFLGIFFEKFSSYQFVFLSKKKKSK